MSRYTKQVLLPNVGQKGQEKIFKAKLLVVGLGGIGSPLIRYLVSCGIGNIDIIDDDIIEEHNLPRQNNYFPNNIDESKVEVTKRLMFELNPQIIVTAYHQRLDAKMLSEIIENYDYIIDASDNFKTKFICNDLAHQYKKIFISGSFVGYQGYVGVYKSGIDSTKPCFRCFHPEDMDMTQSRACYKEGVLSSGVGVVGTFMAAEIFKEITGVGSSLAGHVMVFDFLQNKHRVVILKKKQQCQCLIEI